jgi:hypothetical protein
MVSVEKVHKIVEGVIDPEIAKLCDVGRMERYSAEVLFPIAERFAQRTPAVG